MPKVRVSTTVDEHLLAEARAAHGGGSDASLLEAALNELLRGHRRAEIDAAYARAYRDHPLDETDAWGDLGAWHESVSAARGSAVAERNPPR
ncbi:antitoxin MazE5 [Agilicoccus flavus]|uniref:antitoxin MazE5 n=1 Tax=Agilicoccus flavus TaxID=2775968 RepID=UPI001CF6B308|nr:antitoxin MazE5 [Agilicoccus flavus]